MTGTIQIIHPSSSFFPHYTNRQTNRKWATPKIDNKNTADPCPQSSTHNRFTDENQAQDYFAQKHHHHAKIITHKNLWICSIGRQKHSSRCSQIKAESIARENSARGLKIKLLYSFLLGKKSSHLPIAAWWKKKDERPHHSDHSRENWANQNSKKTISSQAAIVKRPKLLKEPNQKDISWFR